MKELKVKNLDIKFSNHLTKERVREAIERGFAGVNFADKEPVYLVTINVGNMRAEQVYTAVKGIRDDLKALGITNCMFVPLCENGIQDIKVIEVPKRLEAL